MSSFFLLVLAALLALAPARAIADDNASACSRKFESYRQLKVAQGIAEKHLPVLRMAARDGTGANTVILIHGLFESPHFLRGIADEFQAAGNNVLSVLLPGQWEADRSLADRVTYRDWLDELDRAVAISACLGRPVIFAGHSVGGLLALAGALRHPRHSAGIALWAPALQLRALPALAGVLGTVLRLDGNLFTGRPADGDETARLAPNLALQAYALSQWMATTFGDAGATVEELRRSEPLSMLHRGVYRKISVPVAIVVADNDPAVSVREARRMYGEIDGRKTLIVYGRGPVWHGNLIKSPGDAYRIAPRDFNPWFSQMAHDVIQFFSRG